MPKVYALNMPSRARPVSPPSLGDGVEVWFQDVSEWFRGVVIQGGYGSRSRGHHFNVKFDFDGSTELVDCSGGQWRRPSAGGAAGEDADEADEAGEARGAAAREEAQGAAPLRRADKRCRPPSNLSDSVRSKHLPAHGFFLAAGADHSASGGTTLSYGPFKDKSGERGGQAGTVCPSHAGLRVAERNPSDERRRTGPRCAAESSARPSLLPLRCM